MRLVAMQVDGDSSDGDVRHAQGDEQQLPRTEIPDPIGQPIQQRIQPRPSGQQHVNPPKQQKPILSGRPCGGKEAIGAMAVRPQAQIQSIRRTQILGL